MDPAPSLAVRDALALLEVDNLLLGLPDRCFPSAGDEDTGIGSTGTREGTRLLARIRALGFTGIQLGPQGETSPADASPYTSSLFSRGRLGVALSRLADDGAWEAMLDRATVERVVAGRPRRPADRVAYDYAHRAHRDAFAAAFATFAARRRAGTASAIAARLDAFAARESHWLERDALYDLLQARHGGRHWSEWPARTERELWRDDPEAHARREALRASEREALAPYVFTQFVAHAEHDAFRARARTLGLDVWGDLQVGVSECDWWGRPDVFLAGYALGAPPSGTNPEGQDWGYPVLDPGRRHAVAAFVEARAEKTFAEYDGVRIDHPQGLVCPWVYRPDPARSLAAVRAGARLYEAPDLEDHPDLARFALVRSAQLHPDPRPARWADDWVVDLDDGQVERYAALLDLLVAAARRHGRPASALACEVLSTCPYPLARVLARHGLGRCRVTQKAGLDDPASVYRSENAEPPDWVMVGTHDTAPIWLVADGWWRDGSAGERARYLAWRLEPDEQRRAGLVATLASSPASLVQAQFADLLACRARNVFVFFADAFGLRDLYNRPGVVSHENWVLRLPADWWERLRGRLRLDAALNLPLALAMALRSRGADVVGGRPDLLEALEREGAAWRAGGLPG